jgi:hypothetical protein
VKRAALSALLAVAALGAVVAVGCAGCAPVYHARYHHKLNTAKSAATKKRKTPRGVAKVQPPPPPTCDYPKVWQYNHYLCCEEVVEQKTPTSEAEAIAMYRDAILSRTDSVRVLGAIHTGNDGICTKGVVIDVRKLNAPVGIETFHSKTTVVAGAGMSIFELNDWLHARGYSLGLGTLEFRDATLAGAIATGAHGSSLQESSVISSRVESLFIATPADVMAQGPRFSAAKEFSEDNVDAETFRAMRAGMGQFGLVTRVRLRVEPEFNLEVRITTGDDDPVLHGGGVEQMMRDCYWGQIIWFPRIHHYLAFCGNRSTKPVDRDAENTLLTPSASDWEVSMFNDLLEDMIDSDNDYCPEDIHDFTLAIAPPQKKRCAGMDHPTRHAVGNAYRMMSSALTSQQLNAHQNDFEVAIPISRAPEALLEISKTISNPNRLLCLPLNGVFLRFSRSDRATLIGHNTADEDLPDQSGVMFTEYVVYRPDGTAVNPHDKVFGPWWQLTERLIRDFHGRMHWGKNQRPLFVYQREHDPHFAERLLRFRDIAGKYDPQHRLSSPFAHDTGLTP